MLPPTPNKSEIHLALEQLGRKSLLLGWNAVRETPGLMELLAGPEIWSGSDESRNALARRIADVIRGTLDALPDARDRNVGKVVFVTEPHLQGLNVEERTREQRARTPVGFTHDAFKERRAGVIRAVEAALVDEFRAQMLVPADITEQADDYSAELIDTLRLTSRLVDEFAWRFLALDWGADLYDSWRSEQSELGIEVPKPPKATLTYEHTWVACVAADVAIRRLTQIPEGWRWVVAKGLEKDCGGILSVGLHVGRAFVAEHRDADPVVLREFMRTKAPEQFKKWRSHVAPRTTDETKRAVAGAFRTPVLDALLRLVPALRQSVPGWTREVDSDFSNEAYGAHSTSGLKLGGEGVYRPSRLVSPQNALRRRSLELLLFGYCWPIREDLATDVIARSPEDYARELEALWRDEPPSDYLVEVRRRWSGSVPADIFEEHLGAGWQDHFGERHGQIPDVDQG